MITLDSSDNKIVSYTSTDEVLNPEPTLLVAKPDGFSEKELKRARKALKKAGVPKPWLITLTNDEGEVISFEL